MRKKVLWWQRRWCAHSKMVLGCFSLSTLGFSLFCHSFSLLFFFLSSCILYYLLVHNTSISSSKLSSLFFFFSWGVVLVLFSLFFLFLFFFTSSTFWISILSLLSTQTLSLYLSLSNLAFSLSSLATLISCSAMIKLLELLLMELSWPFFFLG